MKQVAAALCLVLFGTGATAAEPVSSSILQTTPSVVSPVDAAQLNAAAEHLLNEVAQPVVLQQGSATFYANRFQGRRTASGERYDKNALTAAHPTLPFGTEVLVRSVQTGKEVLVRIIDRGPHLKDRIIDLSRAAAEALGIRQHGVAEVQLIQPQNK